MKNQRIEKLRDGWVVLLIYNSMLGFQIDDDEVWEGDNTAFPIICGEDEEGGKVHSSEQSARDVANSMSNLFPACTYIVCKTDAVWGPNVLPLDAEINKAVKSLSQVISDQQKNK